jgi:hypothetical protein
MVFGASFDQKAIYVSHSRARERVDTYVPSKEAFLTRAKRAEIDAIASPGKLAEALITAEGLSSSPMVVGNKGDSGSFSKPVALRYWSRSSSSLW